MAVWGFRVFAIQGVVLASYGICKGSLRFLALQASRV